MAVSFVNYNIGAWSSAGGTLTITKPTGLQVGDLLVAHGTEVTAAPAGWTQILGGNGTSFGQTPTWWKVADSADVAASGYNFTRNSTHNCAVMAFRGADNSQPVILYSTGAGGALTSTFTAGTIASPPANCMFLFMQSSHSGGGGAKTFSGYSMTTNNPSWTEIYDSNTTLSNDYDMSAAYSAVRPQTTDTGQFQGNSSGSGRYSTVVYCIQPLLPKRGVPPMFF